MDTQINPCSTEIRELSDDELGKVNGGEQAPLMCTLHFPGLIIAVAASSGGYTTQKTWIY